MESKKKFIELRCKYFWRAVAAEFLATLFFVFLITAVSVNLKNPDTTNDLTNKCLSVGFSAAILVKLFAPISGAHMNPAVTTGATFSGSISSLRGVMYGFAQYFGGIAGAGLTYLLTPTDKQGTLGSVSTVLEVSVTQAFFMELVLSLILTHVVLMCSDQKEGNTGAIVIGLAYSTLHFVGFQYSGAAINPARALGPSLISNTWPTFNWTYWIAPYVGASIAGLGHRFILSKEENCEDVTSLVTLQRSNNVVIEMGQPS